MTGTYRRDDSRLLAVMARAGFFCIGVFAVIWALMVLPAAWRDAHLSWVSNRIVQGYTYKLDDLLKFTPAIAQIERSKSCRPVALHDAAIWQLRITEEAIRANEMTKADTATNDLVGMIRRSLRCAPADPFLWLVLYWAENARHGFELRNLDYLRLSYELGPYEAWIALKRNPMALGVFERLPPDVAQRAVAEFAGLVNSNLYQEAAGILTGPGWRVRDRLLAGLAAVPLRNREIFERVVYDAGFDVQVPGVTPDRRPGWQR